MAAITTNEADNHRLDWAILRDGGVALYWRPEILADDIRTLKASDYQIVSFAAANWLCEADMHDSLMAKLWFPDYYGKNLNALDDCLSDLRVPNDGGLALIFTQYDRFAKAVSDRALGQSTATIVLDIFARASRYHMLFGRRLLNLVQSDDPEIEFGRLAGVTPTWNSREWLNANRGL